MTEKPRVSLYPFRDAGRPRSTQMVGRFPWAPPTHELEDHEVSLLDRFVPEWRDPRRHWKAQLQALLVAHCGIAPGDLEDLSLPAVLALIEKRAPASSRRPVGDQPIKQSKALGDHPRESSEPDDVDALAKKLRGGLRKAYQKLKQRHPEWLLEPELVAATGWGGGSKASTVAYKLREHGIPVTSAKQARERGDQDAENAKGYRLDI